MVVFIGVALSFVLWYFVAKEVEQIATKKGFPEKKYFWWTFWIWPVGLGMVIALPDRGNTAETLKRQTADELPEL